jgi:hypothetical protein
MSVASLAESRQNRLIGINDTVTSRALLLWSQMDVARLDESWQTVGPAMVQQVTAAQYTAATGADRFTDGVSSEYDFTIEPSRLVPEAFAGIDGAGRPVEGLLYGAVTTTKEAIGAGLGPRAFEAGASFLASMVKTAVADLGRSADMVSATGKGYTQYIRVVNPGACSRCAILAGVSDYKRAFKRHPACKCTSVPVVDDGGGGTPKGLFDNPGDYFESLSPAEQERVFTKAGAQAIRDGADPVKVASARRGGTGITTSRGIGRQTVPNSGRRLEPTTIGYKADGSPIRVHTTSEGTTRRGRFGRAQERLGVDNQRLGGSRYSSTSRVRLMPESIYQVARTPAEARVLLRDAGYIETPRLNPTQRIEQAARDRQLADRLYARAGFTL